MRISGSYKELGFLMRLATQMKGEHLYFGPEGDFWMIYDGGRAAYLRTKLDISHHIAVSPRSFKAIHNTLLRTKKNERIKDENADHLGNDFIRIDTDHIQVGFDSTTKILMNTYIERLDMFSPVVERFEKMKDEAEPDGTPYITLEDNLIFRYSRDVRNYLRGFKRNWNFNTDLFREQDDETSNIMRMEPDGELAVFRSGARNVAAPTTKFRYTTGWCIPDRFQDYTFYMSDTDLRLMALACRYESIFEFRILLFKEHYVIDATEADLRFKMWLNREKSTAGKKML